MKRLLLLVALCMALAFVLAAPAMAQSASASADPCPDPDFPRETPDGCQASDLPDVDPNATASPSSTASPSAGREGDPCGSFVIGTPEADECYRSFGLEPLEPGDASPTASLTASPSASASASATASALPKTGGPNPAAFALPSLVLLVAGGIFAARLVRR